MLLRLASIGLFYLSLASLVMGVAGSLDLLDLNPIAGLLLFFLFREVSEISMAYALHYEGE